MRRSTPRIPLSGDLATRPFTIAEALAAGMGEKRLRGGDLERPFFGVRSVDAPTSVLDLARAFATRMPPGAAYSGRTAAMLMGAPLPYRLRSPLPLEVAMPRPGRALRAAGVAGRSLTLLEPPRAVRGVPVVSPPDLWVRMASELTVGELVALGDFLIHRGAAWTDPVALGRAIEVLRARSRPLRTALGLLDENAESAPESEVRVCLVQAGLSGFVANLPVVVGGRSYRLDIAFPRERVAIEYQGDYHRDPLQWRRDMSRRARLEAAGWIVIEINHDDLQRPAELVALVRAALARRGSVAHRP